MSIRIQERQPASRILKGADHTYHLSIVSKLSAASVPKSKQPSGKGMQRFTGKVAGLISGRSGDFAGFRLDTEGSERRFRSNELKIECLVQCVWSEQILITVVERDDLHRSEAIVSSRSEPFNITLLGNSIFIRRHDVTGLRQSKPRTPPLVLRLTKHFLQANGFHPSSSIEPHHMDQQALKNRSRSAVPASLAVAVPLAVSFHFYCRTPKPLYLGNFHLVDSPGDGAHDPEPTAAVNATTGQIWVALTNTHRAPLMLRALHYDIQNNLHRRWTGKLFESRELRVTLLRSSTQN